MFFHKAKDETSRLENLLKKQKSRPSLFTLHQLLDLFPRVTQYYDSLMTYSGPDTFPYVNFQLRSKYENQNQTTLKDIAEQCLSEGYGVTINRSTMGVDWVFSLGDFIPLARKGVLIGEQGFVGFQSIRFRKETTVQTGCPSEDLIPLVVRKHLRDYLQSVLKIEYPKFCLMYNPKDTPPYTMLFNISKDSFKSETEFQNALFSLAWFFPKTVYIGTTNNNSFQYFDI